LQDFLLLATIQVGALIDGQARAFGTSKRDRRKTIVEIIEKQPV